MPMPDKNIKSNEKPVTFYSVIYRKYDNPTELHGKLYLARHAYLEDRANVKRVIDDVCDGVDTKWVYQISKKGLKWKKTKGGKVVQRTVPEATGYGVVTLGNNDRLISKIVFDDNHQWVHNYYYQDDDMIHPAIIIQPIPQENALNFLVYDKKHRNYLKSKLYACPIEPGSALQTIVNNEIGEPEVCAATSQGDFCYCSRTECNRRLNLAQNLSLKEDGTIPKWDGPNMKGIAPTPPDFDPNVDLSNYKFNFTPKQMGVKPLDEMPNRFHSEQTKIKIAPNLEKKTNLGEKRNNRKSFVDFETLLHADLPEEKLKEMERSNEMALEESKQRLKKAKCELKELKDIPSGSRHRLNCFANRQLKHVESQPQKPCVNDVDAEGFHIVKQVENMISQVDRMIRAESFGKPKQTIKQQELHHVKPLTVIGRQHEKGNYRDTEAVRKNGENKVCTDDVFRHTEKEPVHTAINSISAAKRIVVSEKESYLYFGSLINGLRQGRGRTEMEQGHTAYDGQYKNDKRDGFGAYYYKSGQICYVGHWKENKRSGVGVSYTQNGETIHVGSWCNDKPVGTGAIFDKDGNLSFAGILENGVRQGVGISYRVEDSSIIVAKWKDNMPTGKGSEFDNQGNLTYTGMWKNGKRHGFGTEYNKDGEIIFKGQWENDQYLDGVLYQKIQQAPDQDTELDS